MTHHITAEHLVDAATKAVTDIAVGYINTELDLLCRYNKVQESMALETPHRWTGTLNRISRIDLRFAGDALHQRRRIGNQ